MQLKIFWITFIMLGLLGDILLPFLRAMIATIPILILSWWMTYKTELFES